jgi:hypothetical protein
VKMGFVARRNLERRSLDLDEVPLLEKGAHRSRNAATRQQERTAVGMDVGGPPG